jgi:hypothetical protein
MQAYVHAQALMYVKANMRVQAYVHAGIRACTGTHVC